MKYITLLGISFFETIIIFLAYSIIKASLSTIGVDVPSFSVSLSSEKTNFLSMIIFIFISCIASLWLLILAFLLILSYNFLIYKRLISNNYFYCLLFFIMPLLFIYYFLYRGFDKSDVYLNDVCLDTIAIIIISLLINKLAQQIMKFITL